MTLADRIKYYREEAHLTQEELAKAAGTSRQNIYKYEKGIIESIPYDKFCKLAEALSVPPEVLVGWETESEYDCKVNLRKLTQNYTKLTPDHKKKLIDYTNKLLELQDFEEGNT